MTRRFRRKLTKNQQRKETIRVMEKPNKTSIDINLAKVKNDLNSRVGYCLKKNRENLDRGKTLEYQLMCKYIEGISYAKEKLTS